MSKSLVVAFGAILLMQGICNASPQPTGGAHFIALGAVVDPGTHAFTNGMDMLAVIRGIGGIDKCADLNRTTVYRKDPSGKYQAIHVRLGKLLGKADLSENLSFKADDVLYIPFDVVALALSGKSPESGADQMKRQLGVDFNQSMNPENLIRPEIKRREIKQQ